MTAAKSAAPLDTARYWEERLRANPGLLGVGYTRLGLRFNAIVYALRSEVFRRLAREWKLLDRNFDVCDIGSGTGHYVREWLAAGTKSVTATDLTSIAVERLRGEFPGTPVVQFDVSAAQRPAELTSYDVVSAFDMLFHIVDDAAYARAIKNCYELVRPGGYFLMSEMLPHHERHAVPHMVSRTLGEVSDLLTRTGFEIVDRRPMFVLMNYPVDAGKLAQYAWSAMAVPSFVSEAYGALLGRALLPLERKLVQQRRESPTTEIMLCRKPA